MGIIPPECLDEDGNFDQELWEKAGKPHIPVNFENLDTTEMERQQRWNSIKENTYGGCWAIIFLVLALGFAALVIGLLVAVGPGNI